MALNPAFATLMLQQGNNPQDQVGTTLKRPLPK
ncbi:uncharacterized protein G2W53_014459 [Senna tora]|uniref:Uncharacterized protein n=1 Tax=Senna tora TaxID=362788 RepID=A0A835C6G3_9FABA|nr:uncharacterized protein G2W53_014459 [Senna tora]